MYVIKDQFRILVIVSVNAINHVMLVSVYTMKTVNVEKKIVDKLVDKLPQIHESLQKNWC